MNNIICGDSLTELKKLPSESVNCVMTSPPYFGLRDYGTEGIIWDGKEDCEHEFETKERKIHSGTSKLQKKDLNLSWNNKHSQVIFKTPHKRIRRKRRILN